MTWSSCCDPLFFSDELASQESFPWLGRHHAVPFLQVYLLDDAGTVIAMVEISD